MKQRSNWTNSRLRQYGVSLSGFVFVIVIIALAAILGIKVVPTMVEFSAIKKAMEAAKATGSTVQDIQAAFNKHRAAGYIESVEGRDLEITRTATGMDISVAYEKRIGLFGPVSLVIDYVASTGATPAKKPQ
jgi:Tfp pilus assembly major pilin PilA